MNPRLATANGWLSAHRGLFWWLVVYVLVVAVVAALAQHFGASAPSPPLGGFPGSD